MSTSLLHWLHDGRRFVAFGALNTLLSYALFCALALWLPAQPAYAIAFACGLLFAFVGNSRWVFRVQLRWRRLLPVTAVYLAQYLGNAALLQLAIVQFGWPPPLALAAALLLTVPLTFVLNRQVLRG